MMIPGDTVVLDGELDLINEIEGEFGVVTKVTEYDAPTYTGETVVDPDFVGKVLQTAGKVLTQNVTIKPIEVQTVSNLSGGNTVYIGGII